MTTAAAPRPSALRVGLAWGVHLYTAAGAVVGALALLAVVGGDFARAVLWMLAAIIIDATDGMLARAVGVARVLPNIDGRRLDDMVDYLNYVVVPVVFMLATGSLNHPAWAAVPILASAYGFAQTDAKTPDDFFLGWPSYWNVVAIYAWLLDVSPAVTTAWVIAFAALVFVPLKYIYPSRMHRLRGATTAGSLASVLVVAWAVIDPERARALRLIEISLLFPIYYFAVSCWLGGWLTRRPSL